MITASLTEKYRILGKKGEGTFSEVLKCQNIYDNTFWACKKMKQLYDSIDQVNNLREVQALRRLSPHNNILQLYEVIFEKKSGTLVLVCELMDMNVYELIRDKRTYLPSQTVKNYMYQLVKSVDHMHRNGIFHRDVKPENILVKDDLLKLADFGSCRSVFSKQPFTEYISTRWYRAPECLLTDGYYGYQMDLWSVGCVFFEILSLHPLFPGSNEVDQISKIHDILGTPDVNVLAKLRNKSRGMNFNFPPKKGAGLERLLPHAPSSAIDLIYQLCSYDPADRILAKHALRHSYFREMRENDKKAQALIRQGQQSQSAQMQAGEMQAAQMQASDAPDDRGQGAQTQGHQAVAVHAPAVQVPKHASVKIMPSNASSETCDTAPPPRINLTNQVTTDITPLTLTKAQSFPSQLQAFRDRRKYLSQRRYKQYDTHSIGTGLCLPRVSMHASINPAYHNAAFSPTFSKHTSGATISMLPSIASPYKNKKASNSTSKNVFRNYQLPSIDRRGAGF